MSGILGGPAQPVVLVDQYGTPITSFGNTLPAGAATAAKQPALGTAGTPSADVISVQGVTGGTPQPIAASDDTIITALTVSTSPAYTAKDSIGGKITLTGAIRVAGATSVLQSLMLMDRSGQKPTGFIQVFNADPAAATITDNAAFVSSTDDAKIIATVPIIASDWVVPGTTKAFANIRNIGALVEAASGTTLYAAFVCDNTPTFVATTDMQIVWGFLR